MKIHKNSNSEFIEVVKNSLSIAECLRKLKLSAFGASYRGFRIRCKELNLDTSYFTGQGHLKDKTHAWSKSKPLEEILIENSPYNNTTSLKSRLVKEEKLSYYCSDCGIYEWNSKQLVLHLDHINGVNDDNRIENLRLLCPNCHSQTDTYCGKNKAKTLNQNEFKETPESILRKNTKYRGNEIYVPATCQDCNKQLESAKRKICKSCYNTNRKKYSAKIDYKYKIVWPPLNELLQMLEASNYTQVGKKLGISDNAIRKHIKNLNESKTVVPSPGIEPGHA